MPETKSEIAKELLKKPYARMIFPERDGTFRAEIMEFPGCIAIGETATLALESLESTAEAWINSALANSQEIPPPVDQLEYNGKFVIRIPKNLHRYLVLLAQRDGVSLNDYILTCLAGQVGWETH